MAEEQLVAPEAAEDEFARMCTARSIDTNVAGMTPEDAKQFADQKKKVINAICRGHVTVDKDGTTYFKPPSIPDGVSAFRFGEATGADLMAADSVQGGVEKTVAVATSMTGCKKGAIAQLKIRDFHVACALANLFLD